MEESQSSQTKFNDSSVEFVLPVYNEEAILESSVSKLVRHLQQTAKFNWCVTVVDNASTDSTLVEARRLSERLRESVSVMHLPRKGRGYALSEAWQRSNADVVAYMDIDLSTNLEHIESLVMPLLHGDFHVATGSRLSKGSDTTRQLKRELISRGYNFLVWSFFPGRQFVDAQCGFKALSKEAAKKVLPLVRDTSWFFDTELLIRAEQIGYEILEIPVQWIEDLDSRVKILRTAAEDIQGLIRVKREPLQTALARAHSRS